jgi:hypothetical protein
MDIFQKWILLRDLSLGHLPDYGDFPAVYALRDSRNGEILKFGCAGCLRKRIFTNYLCGFGGKEVVSTTQRLHVELFTNKMIDHVELAWSETVDRAEAKHKESEMRMAYKEGNGGKRPVWDRNG